MNRFLEISSFSCVSDIFNKTLASFFKAASSLASMLSLYDFANPYEKIRSSLRKQMMKRNSPDFLYLTRVSHFLKTFQPRLIPQFPASYSLAISISSSSGIPSFSEFGSGPIASASYNIIPHIFHVRLLLS